ncbi:glutathione S-transferase T3-like [Brassica rapa]|uniref:glutathione S-transferase T3-like n=1 Tax=Brassica campestris TaxID=3711 RepID=UPI00142DCCBB|nr:glutathione S-transferase T3-like [Brassica rapa]
MCVNFGESQPFPAFSSQQSQDAPLDPPVQTPAARGVRRKWNPADDEVLISVWLNTSKDAIVANEQRSGAFWKRVAAYYAASPHGIEDGGKEHGCCKKRWHRINEDVNKFCAAYSAAERQMRSGESDTDVLKKKWLSLNAPTTAGVSKRKNVDVNSQTSNTEGFVDVESRPEGVKAAKAKRNTGKGKSVAEIATVWEMKKDDLVRKERLSRLAILDTLLTRTEPLTEAEVVVKNKLLAELF